MREFLKLLNQFWWVVLFLALCSHHTAASAQTLGGVRPQTTSPSDRGVLTAFRTSLDFTKFSGVSADTRFNWDVDVRLDTDLFDLGIVRGNLLANVETIIGSQFRDVDPNQNNYVLDFSLFVRLPRGEIGTSFHHVSRHLVDRADQGSVSWNMVGVSYGDRFEIGQFLVDAGVRGMGTVERASVDYVAQFEWYGNLEAPINPRVSVIVGAEGVIVPVEREMLRRTTRKGGRVLGGVRLPAVAGTIDLFVAWEQRIDAGQFTRDTPRWMQFGIRLNTQVP